MNRHGTPVRASRRRCSSAVSSIGVRNVSRGRRGGAGEGRVFTRRSSRRSPIRPPRPRTVGGVTTATPTRNLTLDGVFNFRDLGGYPTADGRHVRWRTVFRADGLGRLTADDLEVLRPDRAARRRRPAHRARARRARPLPVRDVPGDVPPPVRHRPDVGP